ncbi:unnamed protein product [Closterium sp. NIES-54]
MCALLPHCPLLCAAATAKRAASRALPCAATLPCARCSVVPRCSARAVLSCPAHAAPRAAALPPAPPPALPPVLSRTALRCRPHCCPLVLPPHAARYQAAPPCLLCCATPPHCLLQHRPLLQCCPFSFDAEGRLIEFESWLEDLHLYLQSVTKDDVSLFEDTAESLKAPKPPVEPAATVAGDVQKKYRTDRLACT